MGRPPRRRPLQGLQRGRGVRGQAPTNGVFFGEPENTVVSTVFLEYRPPPRYNRPMSKGFCIVRVEKIKSAGGVAVALGHNTRERETVNADPALKDKNKVLGSTTVEKGMSKFRGLISQDKKPRKNAVLCLDYLISATNKTLDPKERTAYLTEALEWIKARHGAENVLQVAVHRDENTDAHMHVLVVPLTLNKHKTPKLNASKWVDGKKKLSEMQTEFAKEVGAKFDLSRGVEGSVAKHDRVKKFYGLVKNAVPELQIDLPRPPKLGAIWDLDNWKKTATEMVFTQINPTMEALGARSEKLRITEKELYTAKVSLYKLNTENKALRKENTELRNLLENAPFEQIQGLRDEKAKAKELEKQQSHSRDPDRGVSR